MAEAIARQVSKKRHRAGLPLRSSGTSSTERFGTMDRLDVSRSPAIGDRLRPDGHRPGCKLLRVESGDLERLIGAALVSEGFVDRPGFDDSSASGWPARGPGWWRERAAPEAAGVARLRSVAMGAVELTAVGLWNLGEAPVSPRDASGLYVRRAELERTT